MRNILSVTTVIGLAMLLGCQTASSSSVADATKNAEVKTAEIEVKSNDIADSLDHQTDDDAKRISLDDAKTAFDKGDAVFIDTRSESAFQNEHIKGAINIPWKEVEKRYKEIPQDKTIVVYCS